MNLEPHLHTYAFRGVERPPELWEADTEEGAFVRLLAEMVAAGIARGSEPSDLVLSVNNVVIDPDAADESHPAGEYVALQVGGGGSWFPEGTWWPEATDVEGPLAPMTRELRDAGAAFAYSRDLQGEGAIIACLPRLVPRPDPPPR